MSARVILASGIAALVGALAWGGITYLTNYEIGYVAWGIGALIGGAAVALGGGGSTCGVVCALMAVVSIFAGKMMAVQFSAPREIRKIAEQVFTPTAYAEAKKDAEDFAKIESKDYAEFMVTHGFSETDGADNVSVEEVADFERQDVSELKWLENEKPTYEQWREKQLAEATEAVAANLPVMDLVIEDLGAIDILFAVLGIGTAYQIPAKRKG